MRMQQRLVDVRVEGFASLPEGFQAVLGGDPLDFFRNSLEATVQFLVLASRTHIVQDRKEVLQHTLDGHLASKITIAVDTSLVVHVLGLEPLQIRRPFGQRCLELTHLCLSLRNWTSGLFCAGCGRSRSCLRLPYLIGFRIDASPVPYGWATLLKLGLRAAPMLLLGYAHFASLEVWSSSTISASTTSSSLVLLSPLDSACSLGSPASDGAC